MTGQLIQLFGTQIPFDIDEGFPHFIVLGLQFPFPSMLLCRSKKLELAAYLKTSCSDALFQIRSLVFGTARISEQPALDSFLVQELREYPELTLLSESDLGQ